MFGGYVKKLAAGTAMMLGLALGVGRLCLAQAEQGAITGIVTDQRGRDR